MREIEAVKIERIITLHVNLCCEFAGLIPEIER